MCTPRDGGGGAGLRDPPLVSFWLIIIIPFFFVHDRLVGGLFVVIRRGRCSMPAGALSGLGWSIPLWPSPAWIRGCRLQYEMA